MIKSSLALPTVSLLCLIVAVLIFGIALPVYFYNCKVPQIRAQQVHARHFAQGQQLENETLNPSRVVTIRGQENNRFVLEAAESRKGVYEKWLQMYRERTENARQEIERQRDTPLTQTAWFSAVGLSSVLSILSLFLGFYHLRRLRRESEAMPPNKPGLLPASFAVLLVPFLLSVIVGALIILSILGTSGHHVSDFLGLLFTIHVGFACIYFFGLYRIIQATRIPQSPHLHDSRGHMAAILVLLSILVPVAYLITISTCGRTAEIIRIHERFGSFADNERDWHQRGIEVRETLGRIQEKIYEEMERIVSGSREDRELLHEHEAAIRIIDGKMSAAMDIGWRRDSEMMGGHNDFAGFGLLSLFISLLFALPGTMLGIGYVSRIRKERERPGLGAGLFAALTLPLVVAIGGTVILIVSFGLIGFLIVLSTAGILVGTFFAVRYWLAQ